MAIEFKDKKVVTLQNKAFEGGQASATSWLSLPHGTTQELQDEVARRVGAIAWDTTLDSLVVDDGTGFQPVGGGGSGANVTLSNLTSPTAMNQDLIFDTGDTALVKTKDESAQDSQRLQLTTGDVTNPGDNSGRLELRTGSAIDDSGRIEFRTGGSETETGLIDLRTGPGSVDDANTGDIFLRTGAATGTGNSGSLRLSTGGVASGQAGSFFLKESSLPAATAGDVLTLINQSTGEVGYAPAGAATGDANSLAYFDASGNLASNDRADFDESLNSLSLYVSTGGPPATISASGQASFIQAVGNTALNAQSPGPASFIQVNGDGTATASGANSRIQGQAGNGAELTASSEGSTVVGQVNVGFARATGPASLVRVSGLEQSVTAAGNSSAVEAYVESSTANSSGIGSRVSGYIAVGSTAEASGTGAIVHAVSLGNASTASGTGSYAHGDKNLASGNFATTFGVGHDSAADNSFAVGVYSDVTGVVSTPAATDSLFVVGNGANLGSPANAIEVCRDGRINTSASTRTKVRGVSDDAVINGRTDRSIFVDSSTNAVALTMPPGEDGLEIFVKDAANNAGSNAITFIPDGTDTMEIVSDITTNRGARHFQFFDGVWYIMNNLDS